MNRFIIATIPKAGTYLLADVLGRLGLTNTNWHLGVDRWQDYSEANKEDAKRDPSKFTHFEGAKDRAAKIPLGAFAVAHLGPKYLGSVSELKVIFLHRDLRETIPSWAKWIRDTRRWSNRNGWMDRSDDDSVIEGFLKEHGRLVADENRDVCEWHNNVDVLEVAFGSLTGKFGVEAQQKTATELAEYLAIDGIDGQSVLAAIEQSLNSDTLTRSSSPGEESKRLEWGEGSKAEFNRLGLDSLNQRIGYGLPGLMHLRESFRAARKCDMVCPICSSGSHEVFSETDRYGMPVQIVLCKECLHGYVNPVPEAAWFDAFYRDIYWRIYSFGGMEHEHELSQSRGGQIIDTIEDRLGAGIGVVMDVGCGSCGMIPVMQKRFPNARVVATDPSSEAVSRARAEGASEVYQTAWRDSERHKNSPRDVEFATCIHVLEHVAEPLEMLRNLRSAIKPGGQLYLEVPDLMSEKWFGIGFLHLAHVNYFGETSLVMAANKAGFRVDHIVRGATKEWPWAIGVLVTAAEPDGFEQTVGPGISVNEALAHIRRRIKAGEPGFLHKAKGKLVTMLRGRNW